MAPVVHGLEQQYKGRVDFVYLDVSDPDNKTATTRLGFKSTPHFFFLRPDGVTAEVIQGVVSRDSLVGAIERLVAAALAREETTRGQERPRATGARSRVLALDWKGEDVGKRTGEGEAARQLDSDVRPAEENHRRP